MTKVSCIIPAYNEESTIAGVVKTCLKTLEIGEIIVVSDGSTDKTVDRVRQIKSKKIKIIDLPENHGKGFAVVEGVQKAKYENLLFLDADLVNLEPHHLSSLIWPVINNRADMTIGDWDAGFNPHLRLLSPPLAWYFSGQRCLKKNSIFPHLKEIEKSQYTIEIFLNELFKNKRVVVVPLVSPKRLHTVKKEKWVGWKKNYLKENVQLAYAVIKNKNKVYQKKVRKELIRKLASYFRTTTKKIRQFLEEK